MANDEINQTKIFFKKNDSEKIEMNFLKFIFKNFTGNNKENKEFEKRHRNEMVIALNRHKITNQSKK